MKFRTEIPPLPHAGLINHDTTIVTIGSCFADEIGKRLRDRFFDIAVNPFGTLFNPASICDAVNDAISQRKFTIDDVVAAPDANHYVTFNRHSSFRADSAGSLVDILNRNIDSTKRVLQQADIVMLTLGSARRFILNKTGATVANCHRFHPDNFTIGDLTEAEITDMLSSTIAHLRDINPGVTIILTVSPVRHIAYGAIADSLSKARLRIAVDNITTKLDNTIYFPAYEAMVDDLRDYRFYADDLVHPSALGAEYIFNLFLNSFVKPDLLGRLNSWHKIIANVGNLPHDELKRRAMSLNPSAKTLVRLETLLSNALT